MNKPIVLFICTHNSARSQIAEGYLKNRYGERYSAYSAGTEVTSVHPLAIKVMDEIGIDISNHRSKPLLEFFDTDIDIVVTVCDGAKSVCPVFPGAKKTIHQGFTDPSSFMGSDDEKLAIFRIIRDEIIRWIDENVDPGGFLVL
ncbi:arsenate reductase ArsC [Methanospirillum stamsii]|uniref:Low molecular weight phosphatase family protein n=1 Tax=Methanospirillum stamsii TaxID=1277351 RepID=A0A2V2N894_9EURY|nr:arsenate reductase ArsC [Methanospirillum stamsii]PWR74890.1 low molecular weight phosphatase family protein [Methanospirillum stamsii]